MITRLKMPFQGWKAFGIFWLTWMIFTRVWLQLIGNPGASDGLSLGPVVFVLGAICSLFTFPLIFNFAVRQGWINAPLLGKADDEEPTSGRDGDREPPAQSFTEMPMTVARAYELLGLHPSCSDDQLDSARKHLVSKWHPDKLNDAAEEIKKFANDKLAEINGAYDLIREYRAQYQGASV